MKHVGMKDNREQGGAGGGGIFTGTAGTSILIPVRIDLGTLYYTVRIV